MGIAADKRDIDISGASAEVKKVMAANPRRIAQIVINISMPTQDYTESEKKLLEKAAHNCPVGLSLAEETEEVITINWS